MEAVIWKVLEAFAPKLVDWLWKRRPRLEIESVGDNAVLETHERHTVFGCSVRNAGKLTAADVRVQLLKVEARLHSGSYRTLFENTYDLRPAACTDDGSARIVLVPGAKKDFGLASSSDSGPAYSMSDGIVFPSVAELPEHFEDLAVGIDEYRYTITAFDHPGPAVTRTIHIRG